MSLTCPHCHQPFTLTAVAAGGAAGTAPTPVPAATHWFCPIHQRSKIVPAGTSKKTNQPYHAFWACPEMGCDQRPPRGFPVPSAAVPVPIQPPPVAPSGLEPLPEPPSDLSDLPF